MYSPINYKSTIDNNYIIHGNTVLLHETNTTKKVIR